MHLKKNWSVGILNITFGQFVYWSEWAKFEANVKESDWSLNSKF